MKSVRIFDVLPSAREIIAIDVAARVQTAVLHMRQNGIHHLVVTDAGAPVGVLSFRDIVDRGLLNEGFALNVACSVSDLMQECGEAVTQETTVRDALQSMASSRCHALPVVTDGVLTGILTESTLLRMLNKVLDGDSSLETASRQGQIVLSNPLMQNALNLLAEAGI